MESLVISKEQLVDVYAGNLVAIKGDKGTMFDVLVDFNNDKKFIVSYFDDDDYEIISSKPILLTSGECTVNLYDPSRVACEKIIVSIKED
jgi:hypothetical protein